MPIWTFVVIFIEINYPWVSSSIIPKKRRNKNNKIVRIFKTSLFLKIYNSESGNKNVTE